MASRWPLGLLAIFSSCAISQGACDILLPYLLQFSCGFCRLALYGIISGHPMLHLLTYAIVNQYYRCHEYFESSSTAWPNMVPGVLACHNGMCSI